MGRGDLGRGAEAGGHGPRPRRAGAGAWGEDRGRGCRQRRQGTTRSGLSGREERVTRLVRGVGARAGARRGAAGGYEEGARHIIRALGGDVQASFIPAGLSVVVHRGALVLQVVESGRGARPPGAGSRTGEVWRMRRADARGGGEKTWGGGDAGALRSAYRLLRPRTVLGSNGRHVAKATRRLIFAASRASASSP